MSGERERSLHTAAHDLANHCPQAFWRAICAHVGGARASQRPRHSARPGDERASLTRATELGPYRDSFCRLSTSTESSRRNHGRNPARRSPRLSSRTPPSSIWGPFGASARAPSRGPRHTLAPDCFRAWASSRSPGRAGALSAAATIDDREGVGRLGAGLREVEMRWSSSVASRNGYPCLLGLTCVCNGRNRRALHVHVSFNWLLHVRDQSGVLRYRGAEAWQRAREACPCASMVFRPLREGAVLAFNTPKNPELPPGTICNSDALFSRQATTTRSTAPFGSPSRTSLNTPPHS